MEKAQQVKCSLPMIGNIVYGPLIRFEIEVNPILHGGSGGNVPLRNYLFVCFFFHFLHMHLLFSLS